MKATITKIGNLALGRLYGNKYDPMGGYERQFIISKENIDLEDFADDKMFNSHEQGVRYCKGVNIEIWGIALGLQQLPMEGSLIFNEITDIVVRLKEVPSHLIKREWADDDFTGFKETYTVYRLTQNQMSEIHQAAEQLVQSGAR